MALKMLWEDPPWATAVKAPTPTPAAIRADAVMPAILPSSPGSAAETSSGSGAAVSGSGSTGGSTTGVIQLVVDSVKLKYVPVGHSAKTIQQEIGILKLLTYHSLCRIGEEGDSCPQECWNIQILCDTLDINKHHVDLLYNLSSSKQQY